MTSDNAPMNYQAQVTEIIKAAKQLRLVTDDDKDSSTYTDTHHPFHQITAGASALQMAYSIWTDVLGINLRQATEAKQVEIMKARQAQVAQAPPSGPYPPGFGPPIVRQFFGPTVGQMPSPGDMANALAQGLQAAGFSPDNIEIVNTDPVAALRQFFNNMDPDSALAGLEALKTDFTNRKQQEEQQKETGPGE